MTEIFDKHVGDVKVSSSEELILHGMIEGNVYVSAGAIFVVNGMVIGNIVVEPGGKAIIRGYVIGSVTNQGGVLSIFGTVQGTVHPNSGETNVDQKAVIRPI
jgi:cytoskeletal protein CcmA (bactofilin family)